MSKVKGSRTERELLHMFWKHGWFCIRIAGSGSMPFPCPDLLAGKDGRSIAVECKSGKGKQRRYISKEQIGELESFSKGFGADAWVGVRFDGKKWAFLKSSQLGRSKGLENYSFDKELVASYGISFESLIE